MKHGTCKRLVSLVLTFALVLGLVLTDSPVSLVQEAEGHIENVGGPPGPGNNWRGLAGIHNPANLLFYIQPSAITGVLTLANYQATMTQQNSWNGHTNRVFVASIVPTFPGPNHFHVDVVGINNLDALGMIMHRCLSTNVLMDMALFGAHNHWGRVEIHMNRTQSVWTEPAGSLTNNQIRDRVISVFRHEVGHVLKLQHPQASNSSTQISGHTILEIAPGPVVGYFPLSVMNQGVPDIYNHATVGVSQHDIQNLRARWG